MLRKLVVLIVILLAWCYLAQISRYDGKTAEEWFDIYSQEFHKNQTIEECVEDHIRSLENRSQKNWGEISEFVLNARSYGYSTNDIQGFLQQKDEEAEQENNQLLNSILAECF